MTRVRRVTVFAMAAALLSSCAPTLVDNFPVSPDCECEHVRDALTGIGLLGEEQVVDEQQHTIVGIYVSVDGDVPYDALRADGALDDLVADGVRAGPQEHSVYISVGKFRVVVSAEGYGLRFTTSDWGTEGDAVTAWNDAERKNELGDEFAQQEADAVALIQRHADILKLLVPETHD